MKKLAILFVAAFVLSSPSLAFANLDDTRQSIAGKYGEYRLVIDTDNQVWAKTDWEAKGHLRAKASSYTHYFTRNDLRIQMEVQYDNPSEAAFVRAQRFTPDMALKVKEFKQYFPEIYQLITSPKAEVFATYGQLTRNFQEGVSPVTMGVVVKEPPAPGKSSYYTVIAFNIQDEGRLIKDPKYIDGDTYIREFTVERVSKAVAHESLGNGWTAIKNYF